MKIELVKIALLAAKAFITWAKPSSGKAASETDPAVPSSSAEPTAADREVIQNDPTRPSEDRPNDFE